MTIRWLGRVLLIGASLTAASSVVGLRSLDVQQSPQERPNILLLLADDLGYADVGFNGGKDIKTPNIDALAARGTRLEQLYVQPVCSPTRAALLTGRYPMRHGLQVGVVRPWAQYGLPLEERTLPQALKDAGYVTALVGKWHLGHSQREYLPTSRGFDHQYGHYNGAIDYSTHIRDGGFDWHRDDKVSHDEGYSTHLIAKEAVRLIREYGGVKPFFIDVSFNAVHEPLSAPDSYMQPYAHLKEPRRTYAGVLSAMDEAIGQIVAALDEKGLRRNTLIIFSSDNGGPAPGVVTDNGPLRAGKTTLYEGGVRAAAFTAWEGHVRPGVVVNQPLHVVDWYPTLLKLAGGDLHQKLPIDGLDAWPTITAGKPSPHAGILINASPGTGSIRVGDWKLVINGGYSETAAFEAGNTTPPAVDTVELFNLVDDPSEKINLSEKHPDKVKELRARYSVLAAQAVPPKLRPRPADFVSPKIWGETAR